MDGTALGHGTGKMFEAVLKNLGFKVWREKTRKFFNLKFMQEDE